MNAPAFSPPLFRHAGWEDLLLGYPGMHVAQLLRFAVGICLDAVEMYDGSHRRLEFSARSLLGTASQRVRFVDRV